MSRAHARRTALMRARGARDRSTSHGGPYPRCSLQPFRASSERRDEPRPIRSTPSDLEDHLLTPFSLPFSLLFSVFGIAVPASIRSGPVRSGPVRSGPKVVYHACRACVSYNATDHRQRFNLDHTDDISSFAIHPSGRLAATGEVRDRERKRESVSCVMLRVPLCINSAPNANEGTWLDVLRVLRNGLARYLCSAQGGRLTTNAYMKAATWSAYLDPRLPAPVAARKLCRDPWTSQPAQKRKKKLSSFGVSKTPDAVAVVCRRWGPSRRSSSGTPPRCRRSGSSRASTGGR